MEAFLVRERFGSALQVGQVDLLLPLSWDLQSLDLIIANACSLECFEPEAKDAESIEDVHFGDTKWLPLPDIINQESRGIKDGFIIKWALDDCLV